MLRVTIFITFLLSLLMSTAHAQGERERDRERVRERIPAWVLLGARHADFSRDVDGFNVGQSEAWYRNRSFRALHIFIDENDIRLINISIRYMNGYVDNIPLGQGDQGIVIKADPGRAPPVVFDTGRTHLSRIELTYRSLAPNAPRAVVRIVGELTLGDETHDEWVELGCQPVRIFGRDRDTFRVGLREGRFRAIRLHIRNADVFVHEMRVIYVNGIPDDIPVKHHLKAGERTRTLPLDVGRRGERAIERVELNYTSEFRSVDMILGEKEIRLPVVCVEGLERDVPF